MKLLLTTIGMCEKKCEIDDLKLIGFFEVLKSLTPFDIYSIPSLCDKYTLKSNELKQLLLLLKNCGLINYSVKSASDSITITIDFDMLQKKSNSFCGIYGISQNIYDAIVIKSTHDEIVDREQLKNSILLIVKNGDYKKYEFTGTLQTKEQLLNYLKNVCVQELFSEHQVYFSNSDAKVIYESVVKFDLPHEVINILVDYTLKTTENNNFNHNFYLKIAQQFAKNKITTIEQSLDHIKKFKDKARGSNFGYIEPTFEKPSQIESDPNFDLEELIENAYN